MRINLLFISLFFLSISFVNAQQGSGKPAGTNPGFYDIQKAFYEQYGKTAEKENGRAEKDGDYEKFKRWEWYWSQRVGKSGVFPPNDVLIREWNAYNNSARKKPESTLAASWTFKGTSSSAGGYHGIGRISCIAFHPTQANTFWVGTPGGGLWKTTDGGATWTTNTDNLPVLGVSDIAIVPSKPDTIFIATGDGDNTVNTGDTKSVGVLKSTDGGSTWTATGLNWSVTSQKIIRRLLLDPTNPQVLLAAASDGIWRSSDGGATWANKKAGWFTDMEFKPGDPTHVYASTFDWNGAAQIYTSADNGVTWTKVTSFTDVCRINLTVAANAPNQVDALCANTQYGLEGLYRSTNSGSSFASYYTGDCTNNMLNSDYTGNGCDGQGNYDLVYQMNPLSANEIWLGGVNAWHSTDGGANWSLNNVWSASQTGTVPEVHADKHFLAYNPLNKKVYECNDGGLYVTSDSGATWTDLTNGMGISEIYRLGTSATVANDVICGLQDNGSKELNAGTWNDRTGGDGMECIIDYSDANTQYATYVQGMIYKTTDGWATANVILQNNGSGADTAGEWVTPYIIHPTNHNTLLVGKNQVYQTTDGGSTWSQLGTISGMTGNIVAMAYAPSNPQTVYVASRYELYVTVNGGSTWTQAGSSSDAFTYIAVDPTNAQKVYVTTSGYTAGSKVFKSADGGSTWSNISGTLANVPVNCIIYEKGSSEGLYIGTDLGVYFRNSSMSDWVAYNNGLPNVVIDELEISYNNNKIWAATYGRGLWSADLYSPTGVHTPVANGFNVSVYPNPSSGTFVVQSSEKISALEISNLVGEKVYSLPNPPNSGKAEVDLSAQGKGVYFVRINSGDKVVTRKLIVE